MQQAVIANHLEYMGHEDHIKQLTSEAANYCPSALQRCSISAGTRLHTGVLYATSLPQRYGPIAQLHTCLTIGEDPPYIRGIWFVGILADWTYIHHCIRQPQFSKMLIMPHKNQSRYAPLCTFTVRTLISYDATENM
jgi:hypothetical protein